MWVDLVTKIDRACEEKLIGHVKISYIIISSNFTPYVSEEGENWR